MTEKDSVSKIVFSDNRALKTMSFSVNTYDDILPLWCCCSPPPLLAVITTSKFRYELLFSGYPVGPFRYFGFFLRFFFPQKCPFLLFLFFESPCMCYGRMKSVSRCVDSAAVKTRICCQ